MALIDPFNRTIKYLRVSVTDRCNLRCTYCMPAQGWHPEGKYSEYLSNDEIVTIVGAFTNLGVSHIRLTGGEPLVRRDLNKLAIKIKTIRQEIDLSISTNAITLSQQAQTLFDAGIKRINVSLDSLDRETFKRITQQDKLDKVLNSIDVAQKIGFTPIKVNCVVMKGVNDQEIETMLDWALAKKIELRFIEVMPIGESGISQMDKHYPADKIMQRITNHLKENLIPTVSKKGAGPAKYYKTKNHQTGIGLITAVSQHFCKTCNRVRLTSRGQLALCLGQEDAVDLRTPLRNGADVKAIESIIHEAIKLKPEKHFFKENRHNIQFRQMVSLGG